MIQFIILLLSFFLSFNVCLANDLPDSPTNLNYNIEEYPPQSLPDDYLFDENDKGHLLEEFDGQVVLLTFWATWCTSCLGEMQDLDILQKDFKKKPLKVIAISEDFKGIDVVSDFYKLHEIKYLDKYIDKKGVLFNAFNIIGVPTSIIINHHNKEVARVIGAVDWNDPSLRNLLNKYLQAAPGNNKEDLDQDVQGSKQNLIINVKKPSPKETESSAPKQELPSNNPPPQEEMPKLAPPTK
ncbi:Cytochrome biogenesis protein tlpA [Rickettsiales bacterium Ac37b]|nr:Cytochrome biogenesis protein tlpA [Rickettsiales bacterium Ac37b]